ncbi:MAG: Flp family type IVb pilin [Candidatus Eremiobacteraeota bacterium]|nr:Flp family type IVb pilin [Candidatus Eremiobacteraeota bacterium]
MIGAFRRLYADASGAALPEYGLVLALFALLSIAALTAIAVQTEATLDSAYFNFEGLSENPPV